MRFLLCFFCLAQFALGDLLSQDAIAKQIESLKAEGASAEEKQALAIWEKLGAVSAKIEGVKTEAAEIKDLIEELEVGTTLAMPEAPDGGGDLEEWVAFREVLANAIDVANQKRVELRADAAESALRNVTLGELIAQTKAALVDLQIPPVEPGILNEANRQLAQHEKALLNESLARYEAERKLIETKVETLPNRTKQRGQQIVELERLLERASAKVAEMRSKEDKSTKDSLSKVEDALGKIADKGKEPLFSKLETLVFEVGELSRHRSGDKGVEAKLADAAEYLSDIQKTKKRIAEQARNARERITLLEAAKLGVDSQTGVQLRRQRSLLPGVRAMKVKLRENVEAAVQAQIIEMELQSRMANVPLTLQEAAQLDTAHKDLKAGDIEHLLERRRSMLISLIRDYQRLNTRLSEATATANLTIADIEAYSAYLDERLLWIKSTEPISLNEPVDEWKRIVGLFGPGQLQTSWGSIKSNLLPRFFQVLVLLIIAVFSLCQRRRIVKWLDSANKKAIRRNCTSIAPTVKAIVMATLLAAGLPSLILMVAVLIDEPVIYRSGLVNLASFLMLTGTMLKFSQKDGLFQGQFKISEEKVRLIRLNLAWLIPVGAPFSFLIGALIETEASHSSGRVVLLVSMGLFAWFIHRLTHPSRSIFKIRAEPSFAVKGFYIVFLLTPLFFGLIACLGYLASVLTLRSHVIDTFQIVLLAFLLVRFFGRWILVSRRRLAITQALQRREVALAERERDAEGGGASDRDSELPSLEEVKAQAVDVVEVEVQTTQLVRLAVIFAAFFAVWGVWANTMPALRVLDRVALWGASTSDAEAPSSPVKMIPGLGAGSSGGESSEETVEKSEDLPEGARGAITGKLPELVKPSSDSVTLQDLFLAILLAVGTISAAKNIPGLLSLTVFNRLKLGPGGNFALTTTARYLIVLIGLVLAFGKIGITWGKVQWLAAAVTLGIGFGLQEIFANFVAGIIMLFERPVRLGDVVTVGEVSGKVTQINIRATTIQQFNNRELLVPNREFITNQLVNWTLRDTVLRFDLMVGIAYGSDTRKAEEILNKILADHPKVLSEPSPDVLFFAFGASTLDFKVRGFVESVDDFIKTQSEVHFLIDDAFREAGIEIAFPQQDIHIRSLPSEMTMVEKK